MVEGTQTLNPVNRDPVHVHVLFPPRDVCVSGCFSLCTVNLNILTGFLLLIYAYTVDCALEVELAEWRLAAQIAEILARADADIADIRARARTEINALIIDGGILV